MKKLKCILIITGIFLVISNSTGAQDIIPPERPMITHVSVDTSTENTLIYWTESTSSDVKWYYLYYEIMTVNGPEGVKLDSVPPGNSFYVHPGNAGTESMVYSISAIDSAGNESVRTPGFHSTVHTTLEYDSCNNAINISWTPYIGWGNNITGYQIYSRRAGEAYGQPQGVSKNDSSFRFENILRNTSYFFYVEALKNDTLYSLSNLAGKYTYMPGPPDLFNLISVDVIGDNSVQINYEFTDTSNINDFRLMRSINKTADFISVQSEYDVNEGENFFIDTIITGTEKFYYKIGALNSCDQIIKESNIGTNILLKGENMANRNELEWSIYEEWETGVSEYQVIRYNQNGNSEVIFTSGPDVSFFDHNLQEIYGTGFDGIITYRVIAKQNGEDVYAQSNLLSIDMSGEITVPNAFTPNNDGRNDIFKPFFTLLPEDFLMVIYDRYGIVVHKTEDPEEGWNGQVNGGSMATEGVYVYHIQYTTHTGLSIEKTGHLTVFYP
ncbi:MAG: gliding motility-associated C-terminal domain-containing protein [Bacteroidota bacterium]